MSGYEPKRQPGAHPATQQALYPGPKSVTYDYRIAVAMPGRVQVMAKTRPLSARTGTNTIARYGPITAGKEYSIPGLLRGAPAVAMLWGD